MHVDSRLESTLGGSSPRFDAVMDGDRKWKRRVDPYCAEWMQGSRARLEEKRAESIKANEKRQQEIAEGDEMRRSGAGDPKCMV